MAKEVNTRDFWMGGKRKFLEKDCESCEEGCDFPSECRWAARLSPGTRAERTGIVSPVLEESEEGVEDAEMVDEMDVEEKHAEMEMETDPPSPKSPLSPSHFPLGKKSPPTSPTSPRESGFLLDKLIQSTEKRKSRELNLASEAEKNGKAEAAKGKAGQLMGFPYPVLDFQTFKKGMDRAHGVFDRATKERTVGEVDTGGREDAPLFEAEELMDIDSLVMPGGIGMTSARVLMDNAADTAMGKTTVKMVGRGGGIKEGDVMQIDTANKVSPPLSPRRNAWDWSIGGLGSGMAFAELEFGEFDMVG